MKKIYLLPLLVLTVAIVLMSCGGGKPSITPKEYNNKVIDIQLTVINKILALNKAFEKLVPAELDAGLKGFQESSEKAVADISKFEAYEGSTTLKDAALNLFKFYQAASINEYKKMIDILKKGAAMTPEDQTTLGTLAAQVGTNEKGFDEAFKNAQQAFSKQYNLPIEVNEKQKEIDNMGK